MCKSCVSRRFFKNPYEATFDTRFVNGEYGNEKKKLKTKTNKNEKKFT